eukprot:365032-Chlamydomonas_euryale.AAC.17
MPTRAQGAQCAQAAAGRASATLTAATLLQPLSAAAKPPVQEKIALPSRCCCCRSNCSATSNVVPQLWTVAGEQAYDAEACV